jgi:hypothetical protein
MTITIRINKDDGRVLCVPIDAAITAITKAYLSNGNECR